MRARVRRLAARIGLALGACLLVVYAAYVVTIYWLLSHEYLDELTHDKEDVRAHVDSGYSLWPGVVHVSGADVRFKDYNIAVRIEAREATLDISLFSLFAKTILVENARVRGGRYSMSHRVHDLDKNRERVAAFPEIGFDRSIVYDAPRPPYKEPTWTVRVEGIDAHVDQAWILEYRIVGPIKARGGFQLKGVVNVLPSEVAFKGRDVMIGDRQLFSQTTCHLKAELGPFPKRGAKLTQVVGTLSGLIDCDAQLDDVSLWKIYGPASDYEMAGDGKFSTALHIKQGALRDSSFDGSFNFSNLGMRGVTLAADLQATAHVDSQGLTQVAAHAAGSDEGRPISFGSMDVAATLQQDHIWTAQLGEVSGKLQGANLSDPEFLGKILENPSSPPLQVLDFSAQGQWSRGGDESDGGSFTYQSAGNLIAVLDDDTLSCPHQAEASCQRDASEWTCSELTFKCNPFGLERGKRQGQALLHLASEAFEWKDQHIESRWSLTAQNPKDILMAALSSNLGAKMGIGLAPLGPLSARFEVHRRGKRVGATLLHFEAGGLSGRGALSSGESLSSFFNVETPVGRVGIIHSTDNTKIVPFVDAEWTPEASDADGS